MPFGDGTGPLGQGPMTGWGRGPCGRGLARGRRGGWRGRGWFGRGFGFGWRWPWSSKWTEEDEKAALDEEERMLEEELAQVRAAKKDLESKK